jgi:HPr kinase/phosphorylase
MEGPSARTTLHATAVAVNGQGLLITGATGTGKSTLALALIGLGASLVSDDQTVLMQDNGQIMLSCPTEALRGVIEARGIGLLCTEASDSVPLALLVDLDQTETSRLPPRRNVRVLGHTIDLVYGITSPTFPVALMLHLRHGRHA